MRTAPSRSLGTRFVILFFVAALLTLSPAAAAAHPAGNDGVVYIVKPGDRLADIAARYKTTASAIVNANGLKNPNVIYPGQRLLIPEATGSGPSSAAPDTTPTVVYHTVAFGDTLDKIARAYGVSASSIIRANGIVNSNLIWVSQRLMIPTSAGASSSNPGIPGAVPTVTPTPVPTPKVHVVQAGETLSQIAKRYGTTVAALVSENGLGSADLIGVGMRLTIPQAGATPTYVGQATRFVASISQQRCWLYRGETAIADWVCSTGRAGSPTVPGTYRIQSKLSKAYGSAWNIWMPYWLGIYWAGSSENGIHGLPWNATSGAQTWTGLVGTPITYGCIMLENAHAKILYDMAYIGMPVIITR